MLIHTRGGGGGGGMYNGVSLSYLYNSIAHPYIAQVIQFNTTPSPFKGYCTPLLIKLHGDHVTLCLYVQMMHPCLEPLSVRVASF